MSTTTFKMPRTFRDFGQLADELGLKAHELMAGLEPVLGDRWMEQGTKDLSFSVTTLGVQDSGEVVPPAGYELAEGCSDYYVGLKVVSSAFVIRPSWHAATGLHSIEVETSDGLGDMQMLAPDEALKLAKDLTAAAESIRPVNITAAVPVAV